MPDTLAATIDELDRLHAATREGEWDRGAWWASTDGKRPMVWDGRGDAIVDTVRVAENDLPYFEPGIAQWIAASHNAWPAMRDRLSALEAVASAAQAYTVAEQYLMNGIEPWKGCAAERMAMWDALAALDAGKVSTDA